MKEEWKDIPEYEGLYQASSLGRIKSLPRTFKRPQNKNHMTTKERVLNPTTHSSGYLRVNLSKNGKLKSRYVHTLVLESFVCRRPNKQDADHKDADRKNNKLSNLRWLSRRENRGHVFTKNPNSRISKFKKRNT